MIEKESDIFADYEEIPCLAIHWDEPYKLRAFYTTGRKHITLYHISQDEVQVEQVNRLPKDYKLFVMTSLLCANRFLMLGMEVQARATNLIVRKKRPRNRYSNEKDIFQVGMANDGQHILLYENKVASERTLSIGAGTFCHITDVDNLLESWLGVVDINTFLALKQMQKDYCYKMMKLLEIDENLVFPSGDSFCHVDPDSEHRDIVADSKYYYTHEWKDTDGFNGQLAGVANDKGLWGFVDLHGNLVIPCQWKWVGRFIHYYAAEVKNDEGKFGLIDRQGHVVEPCVWDSRLGGLQEATDKYCQAMTKIYGPPELLCHAPSVVGKKYM